MKRNDYRCTSNCTCEMKEDIFEKLCQYVPNNLATEYNLCECGFDEEAGLFPTNPMFGQSYVPWQIMGRTFIPEAGLRRGTIFPELATSYSPGDSLALNNFIMNTNTIGEGCNR